jgi:hypothetical protein
MRNVTITLSEELARRARVEAARQDKSLSRFVADLLTERLKAGLVDPLASLREFFDGAGYPGIGQSWHGREAFYAEREDELLRRYQSDRLHHRSERSGQTARGHGFSEADHQSSQPGAKSAKPKRGFSRRDREAKSDADK